MKSVLVSLLLIAGFSTAARADSVIDYAGAYNSREIWARAVAMGYPDLGADQQACIAKFVIKGTPSKLNKTAQALADAHSAPTFDAFQTAKAEYFEKYKAKHGADPITKAHETCAGS